MKNRNLPNELTIIRFFMALSILVLMVFPYSSCSWTPVMVGNAGFSVIDLICAALFVIASITDTLDGNIARKYHLITDFGKFMDPLADKALVNVSLILLAIYKYQYLPSYLSFFPGVIVCLFILRDLAVDGVKMIASSKGKVIAASVWGKAKTVAQMIAIPFVFLNGFPLNYLLGAYTYIFPLALILIALILSLVSGAIYIRDGKSYIVSTSIKEEEKKDE